MPGELVGDSVLIKDTVEASQIYNKGFYGYPQSGGSLELDLLEAIYLAESDRLPVSRDGKPLLLADLIKMAASCQQDFEIRYIVYRDLRQRGYIVKPDAGEFDFRVFPRGGTPTTTQTKYWVLAISERAVFTIKGLFEETERSERTRKELLLAVVDEEGDITYYRSSTGAPQFTVKTEEREQIEAFLLKDRVLVMSEADSDHLISNGFFGKKIGKTLQLSLIETAHLMENGRIVIHHPETGKKLGIGAFKKSAASIQSDFELRLKAYNDLRAKGLVVKTGFKYGSHFRVYDGDP